MAISTVELGRLISKTNFKLFDFDYEVDDLQFKAEIEKAIIDNFYDYEIGFETPDMFKRKFKARWLRAISYYNKLYNTTLLSYNPLINSSMTEALEQLKTMQNTQVADSSSTSNGSTDTGGTVTTSTDGTQNNTRTDNLASSTNTNQKASDYPQQAIGAGDFLSGEQDITSDSTNTGTVTDAGTTTSESTTTSDSLTTSNDTQTTDSTVTDNGTDNTTYTKTIEGLTGTTYQELIQKERENILRITGMIINEMKPCFILVY